MIISDLAENTVCQALYVQNISDAMGEAQLIALTEVLKKKMIWCLNIGENYQISLQGWTRFCKSLPQTNITHLYVSEHTIPAALKVQMRDYIRDNRKKHNLHKSEDNLSVIERCTNMWWNPINHFKHKEEQRLNAERIAKEAEERLEQEKKEAAQKRKLDREAAKESNTAEIVKSAKKREKRDFFVDPAYAEEKWHFSCICGEKCSYYESPRYHPKGAQFECDICQTWSHVKCVLKKLPNGDNNEVYSYHMCNSFRHNIFR